MNCVITLDARGFSWLVAVASHEALLLLDKTRHECLVGGFRATRPADSDEHEMLDPVADVRDVDEVALDRVEHQNRMAALRSIKPQDRQTLFLTGMGYSYREICDSSRARVVNVGSLPRLVCWRHVVEWAAGARCHTPAA